MFLANELPPSSLVETVFSSSESEDSNFEMDLSSEMSTEYNPENSCSSDPDDFSQFVPNVDFYKSADVSPASTPSPPPEFDVVYQLPESFSFFHFDVDLDSLLAVYLDWEYPTPASQE